MTQSLPHSPRDVELEVSTDPVERVSRVLIVIHGIRDRGGWAADFREAVDERGYSTVVAPVVYPRYSSLPFLLGRGVASRRKHVLEQTETICKEHPNAIIDVFCHSNGTKLFAEIVDQIDRTFQTVILAGSICRRQEVSKISRKVKASRLWNICGTRDRWPILAQALRPDLFEFTGVDGFVDYRVRDRFHDFGHSGALDEKFIKDEIIPLLLYGENTKGIGRRTFSWLHNPATYRKIISALLGLGIFALGVLPWWVGAATGAWIAYLYYGWHDSD